MPGLVWFFFFQAFGQLLARRVFSRSEGLERLLLGSVCGSMAAIWLPVPFSFIFGFSLSAHICAAVLALIAAAILYRSSPSPEKTEWREHRAFLVVLDRLSCLQRVQFL